MQLLQRIPGYLDHLIHARSRHAVHSPFVYALIENVLTDTAPVHGAKAFEELRQGALQDDRTVRVTDLGAGSKRMKGNERKIAVIARNAIASERQCRVLSKLAAHMRSKNILELGTSLGITSLYLSRSTEDAQVHTIEGCQEIARIARNNFERMHADNIQLNQGAFIERVPHVLKAMDKLDLLLIDGHHAERPTLEYFELCLPKMHVNSVAVIDDIHWSRGMERAWERIKLHPRSVVTVDLYRFGLVFFREGQAIQHFRLRM